MSEIELRIEEMPQNFVGNGVAIVDPQIIEDNNWNAGQILELCEKAVWMENGSIKMIGKAFDVIKAYEESMWQA